MRRAFLLFSCAVLAACGSSGSHALSRHDYARHADAFCTRYHRLAAALGTPANTRQLAEVAARTLRLLDSTISDLRSLQPPRDEQRLAGRWLASLSTLRGDVVKLRDRAQANDLAGVRRVVRFAQRHNRTSDRLAAELGLTVCSRG